MRRIALLLAASTTLALTAAPAAFAQANDQNCEDFASQAAAQAHLRADPQDPDGLDALPGPADGNDDRNAGGHGDGIACEGRPAPFDRAPVFADSPAPAAPSAPVQPPPTTIAGGPLPFTGPSDTQLPLAAGLLAVGVAIVLFARYRPRHARR